MTIVLTITEIIMIMMKTRVMMMTMTIVNKITEKMMMMTTTRVMMMTMVIVLTRTEMTMTMRMTTTMIVLTITEMMMYSDDFENRGIIKTSTETIGNDYNDHAELSSKNQTVRNNEDTPETQIGESTE
jgi:hypothetical protein